MKKVIIVVSMLLAALTVGAQDRARILEAKKLYVKALNIAVDDDPEVAIPMLEEAMRVFREEKSLPDVRDVEDALSAVYDFVYDYDNAVEYAAKAASHSRELCDTARLVDILMNQRRYCRQLHRLEQAKSLTSEIMSLCLEYSDVESNAGILSKLSGIARNEGDFLLAESLAEMASRAQSGYEDEYQVLDSKMMSAYYKGDYSLAAEYGRELLKSGHSGTVNDAIITLSEVAFYFAHSGDGKGALALMEMVRNVLPRIDNDDNRKFMTCSLLCMAYGELGLYDEALEMYRMSESVGGGKYLRAKPDEVAYSAEMLYRAGKTGESIAEYEKYSALCLDRYGRMSENYALSLNYLANLYALAGDIPRGSSCYIDSAGILLELARGDWKYLPSYERGKLLENMARRSNKMASFAVAAGHTRDEFTAKAYDTHLLFKGLGLATEMNLRDAVKGDKSAKALLDSIYVIRRNLDRAKLGGNSSDVSRLYASLLKAESEIALKAPSLKGYGDFLHFTSGDIKSALGPDDTVIDFTDFVTESGNHYYLAYVMRSDFDAPELVNVFMESQLTDIGIPGDKPWMLYSGDNAKAAYNIVWTPLEKYMKPGGRVFFSPSGILHLLAAEYLAAPDGKLACQRYDIHRVTSARQVAMPKKDIDDGPVEIFASLPEELPYSLREADAVALASGGRAVLHCGTEATVDLLKAVSGGSASVLHFATHGFQNLPTGKYDAFNSLVESMQNSGLRMNDGPVTSEEIAAMDLASSGLVYLSSCRSARGTINQDGVFGLQRAFKKAGAGSLVMSLWDVNDMAACDFAESFYKLLNAGGDASEAFSSTIAKMKQRYRSPYYWAGYLLVD
ncbi:MAG: CHAT domain-containing protein [Candidatus Cryptobacteroides sp.]